MFTTRDEAGAFLSQIAVQMMRGAYIDPNAGKRTLADFVERDWLPGHTADHRSLDLYESQWRLHIKPKLGDVPLSGLKPLLLRQWMKSLEDAGLALATRHAIRGLLSTMLSAAIDAELLATNPLRARSTTLPPRERQRIEPWTLTQVSSMWQELPDRYRLAVALGAGLGLRQGEVFGLAVDDVDFLRRRVIVRRQVKRAGNVRIFAPPKRRKTRMVPMPEHVANLIAEHIRRFPPVDVVRPWATLEGEPTKVRLLLSSSRGTVLGSNWFDRIVWRPALQRAGISEMRANGMHALRHHFASVYLAEGGDIRSLAEFLGHSDAGFTLRTYTHLMPDTAERMAQALNGSVLRAFAISNGTETEQTAAAKPS